jgi:hypothetical protein
MCSLNLTLSSSMPSSIKAVRWLNISANLCLAAHLPCRRADQRVAAAAERRHQRKEQTQLLDELLPRATGGTHEARVSSYYAIGVTGPMGGDNGWVPDQKTLVAAY